MPHTHSINAITSLYEANRSSYNFATLHNYTKTEHSWAIKGFVDNARMAQFGSRTAVTSAELGQLTRTRR